MKVARYVFAAALCLAGVAGAAEFRFPMPEFESGYRYPQFEVPMPVPIPPALDIAVLLGALSLTAWVALERRSRREAFLIAVFSLAYFGFYRKGCICPVGGIQNVLDAAIGAGGGVPIVVAVFFFAPLLFALYFGRVFCAAVCPLGAIQEMAAVHPVQLVRPVEAALGLLPYAYLGIATLGVATGSGYLICRYDPFVGFFRQGASFNMLLTGGLLLVAGIFIARPYCRFLCPYGVLLRWASLYSRRHVSITPKECIQCRLCESSCPYGAIVTPTPKDRPETRKSGARRLGLLLLATPCIVAFAAWTGARAHTVLAQLHPTVRLAERIAAEDRGAYAERSVESDAFRAGRQSTGELYAAAAETTRRFRFASAWFGGFLGLVVCVKLIRLSTIRTNEDYVPDRGACLSCARCFAYCPVEDNHDDA